MIAPAVGTLNIFSRENLEACTKCLSELKDSYDAGQKALHQLPTNYTGRLKETYERLALPITACQIFSFFMLGPTVRDICISARNFVKIGGEKRIDFALKILRSLSVVFDVGYSTLLGLEAIGKVQMFTIKTMHAIVKLGDKFWGISTLFSVSEGVYDARKWFKSHSFMHEVSRIKKYAGALEAIVGLGYFFEHLSSLVLGFEALSGSAFLDRIPAPILNKSWGSALGLGNTLWGVSALLYTGKVALSVHKWRKLNRYMRLFAQTKNLAAFIENTSEKKLRALLNIKNHNFKAILINKLKDSNKTTEVVDKLWSRMHSMKKECIANAVVDSVLISSTVLVLSGALAPLGYILEAFWAITEITRIFKNRFYPDRFEKEMIGA